MQGNEMKWRRRGHAQIRKMIKFVGPEDLFGWKMSFRQVKKPLRVRYFLYQGDVFETNISFYWSELIIFGTIGGKKQKHLDVFWNDQDVFGKCLDVSRKTSRHFCWDIYAFFENVYAFRRIYSIKNALSPHDERAFSKVMLVFDQTVGSCVYILSNQDRQSISLRLLLKRNKTFIILNIDEWWDSSLIALFSPILVRNDPKTFNGFLFLFAEYFADMLI
jgi:hypothetical protein